MSKLNLYIKYLTPYAAEQHLYEAFSKFGNVTSAKTERNPDGTSKRFGFVAFTSEEEAEDARKNMHKTSFMGLQLYVNKFQAKNPKTF